jgi:uncharacterized membrane protein
MHSLRSPAMTRPRTIGNMIAPWRFLVFVAVLVAAVPVCIELSGNWPLGIMAGFDVAAALLLLLCASLLGTRETKEIRQHAVENDANRHLLLAFTGIIMAVLFVAIAAEAVGHNPQPVTKVLIIVTLALAWVVSNVIYALHYAHLAYIKPDIGSSGLEFPGTSEPNYWDFIYFAFTCGMAFATSDVQIKDQHIRKIVTIHCLAAFAFNIGVLAFTVNVLGSAAGG